jgi:hypothetical protein
MSLKVKRARSNTGGVKQYIDKKRGIKKSTVQAAAASTGRKNGLYKRD